jgi:hypothetical protein
MHRHPNSLEYFDKRVHITTEKKILGVFVRILMYLRRQRMQGEKNHHKFQGIYFMEKKMVRDDVEGCLLHSGTYSLVSVIMYKDWMHNAEHNDE